MSHFSVFDFFVVIFVLLFTGVGIANALKIRQALSERGIANQLDKSGIPTEAEVFERHTAYSSLLRGRTSAFVSYSYRFGTEQMSTEQQVSLSHYRRLPLGCKVLIRYLPITPKIARLSGNDVDNSVRDIALSQTVGGIVILLLVCFFFGPLFFTGS